MHATTEQLLSLRDGHAVAAEAAAHVPACPVCREQVARLVETRRRLRSLPAVRPPHGLWQTVATATLREPRRRRMHWAAVAGFAASFVLGLTIIFRMAPDERPPAANAPAAATSPVPLVERSRQLEATLRAMPAAPRVTRVGTALTVSSLEDQIHRIDLRLNSGEMPPDYEEALWRQRVRLMDSLVRVRYAQISDSR